MGYFVITNFKDLGACYSWMVKPNFDPRRAEFGKLLAESGREVGSKQQNVANLPPEQKEIFREKLSRGRGNMTLQEWDDYLADMVDWGLITDKERDYANGLSRDIPAAAQNGGTYFHTSSLGTSLEDEFDRLWTGDPVKFLNNLDAYMLRNSLYANLNCFTTPGLSPQRDACTSVAKLLQEILW